jgi:cytidylate kinase
VKTRLLVGVAGLPGSGKSTLASELATQLHLELFSFGDFFRSIAAGADVQTFGRDYIANNTAADVVDRFFRFYAIQALRGCVIDGIRHVAIWRAISDRTDCARLVFLDVAEDALLTRLMARSGIGLEGARDRLHHPVEAEASRLRDAAEIVLRQPSRATALHCVIDALEDIS